MQALKAARYVAAQLIYLQFVFASVAASDPGPLPWTIPAAGNATLTHYDLPRDSIVSCGCVAGSTHYPTAAINQLAYGSSTSFGPACGRCFHITLVSTPLAALPPDGDGRTYAPSDATAPSVIVKATDLCPAGKSGSNADWCSATTAPDKPNMLGSLLHFDLAWPSKAIPKDFFPLNSQGGDYGVWRVNYAQVPCTQWAGWNDAQAWGSDWSQQDDACCVPDPFFDPINGGVPPSSETMPSSSSVESGNASQVVGAANAAKISHDAQRAVCPSYSRLVASVAKDISLGDVLLANVPNTSNVLTRKKGDDGSWALNGAPSIRERGWRLQCTMWTIFLFIIFHLP